MDLQVVADVPVNRQTDQLAAAFLHVDCRLAVLRQEVQAIGEFAFIIDLAAEVAVQVIVVTAGIAHGHAAIGVVGWAFKHVVGQTTRRGGAVQEAGQAGDHFKLFGFFQEVTGIREGGEAQAVVGNVQIARTAEPANIDGTRIARPCRGEHLSERIAFEHVIQRGCLHVFEQGLRGDAHGVRRVLQLHAAQCADIADVFADVARGFRTLGHSARIDVDVAQGQCALNHRHQRIGTATALLQLQPRAAQCFAQRRGALECAANGRRGFACDQCRVNRQRDAGLAGNLVQRGGQRASRQVVGASRRRLFGGH